MSTSYDTRPEYLGDSVYVENSPFGDVVLTTNNGVGPTNTIILEPGVLKRFEEWLKQQRQKR